MGYRLYIIGLIQFRNSDLVMLFNKYEDTTRACNNKLDIFILIEIIAMA